MERDAARIRRITLFLTQLRTCGTPISWHSANRTGTDILALHVWRRTGVASAPANIFTPQSPFSPQSRHPHLAACAHRWLFLAAHYYRRRPYVKPGCTKYLMECQKVVSRRSAIALPTFLCVRIRFV